MHRVAQLADLARLRVTEDEVQRYEREFTDILGFVAHIEKVPAAARPLRATISGVSHVLRDDVVVPSDLADALLACAPEKRGRQVRVPGVFDAA
jgi:aspartyl-tRNA(Asn)/glutamyl-tRNA(Gln) amidotransferase subunit C